MRLVLLTLLLFFGTSQTTGYTGTLVGDWFQEDSGDATDEKRAFSQPISQSTEDIQVTLGIKSPGSVDLVDFYLVISNKKASLGCQYSVTEIVIDSRIFPTTSSSHSSDIAQITTRSNDEQTRLWREFRKGQKLTLRINQTCNAKNLQDSSVLAFDFSLKGSSAAYRFVAGQEAINTQYQANVNPKATDTFLEPPVIETTYDYESSNDLLIPLLIAFFIVVLIVILIGWLAKPGRPESTFDPGSKRLEPELGDQRQARRATREAMIDIRTSPVSRDQTRFETARNIEDLPSFKVEHVIDGDTVIVSRFLHKYRIRLDSIDCPEDGQEWGNIATAGLIKLIGGKHVHLEKHGLDDYGRTLATIYVWDRKDSKWLNVNERMVTLGHAWVMRMYYKHLPKERRDQLNRLERWAKKKKVGLWNLPNPIPPWNWRRES